ncbi:hypothetical protein JMJ35_004935 [Cladonia borealis]|uniref:Uncharacterized protein n=1 Tax=Cladonia borealis TaxID=184061 RepID=A0AA39R402_9LECA|nr:hypothetical protein JMJ35_004935 [Cladonia borealis]
MHTHTLQAKGSAEPTHQDHDARKDAGFNNPLRQAVRALPSANRESTSERLHLRPLYDVILVSAAFAGVCVIQALNDPFSTPPPFIDRDRALISVYIPIYPTSQFWLSYEISPLNPPKLLYYFKLYINGRSIVSRGCQELLFGWNGFQKSHFSREQSSADIFSTSYEQRSALQRSPILAKFFQSSDYLVGSGTQLEFHDNGVACLRVIKEYLEDGPDIYTADRLRRYATEETATHKVYDFLIVVCVHKSAAKLAVHSLTNLAYAVLYRSECSQTSGRLAKGSHTAQLFRIHTCLLPDHQISLKLILNSSLLHLLTLNTSLLIPQIRSVRLPTTFRLLVIYSSTIAFEESERKSGGDIGPQQNPYLPLTGPPDTSRAHSQEQTAITDQLLAPSDILEYNKPSEKSKENPGLVSEGNNVNRIFQAYDNRLLSKIGKPKTPSRTWALSGVLSAVDDVPSLRSSASTTSARQPRVSSSTNTFSSAERSSSLSAAIPTRTRPVSAGKRASLAGLSRLVGSSYNRSKLNIEMSAPPDSDEPIEKKKGHLISRLMKF